MQRVRAGDGGAVREEELHRGQRPACGGEVERRRVPAAAAGVEVGAVGDEEFEHRSVVEDGPVGLVSEWVNIYIFRAEEEVRGWVGTARRVRL